MFKFSFVLGALFVAYGLLLVLDGVFYLSGLRGKEAVGAGLVILWLGYCLLCCLSGIKRYQNTELNPVPEEVDSERNTI